MEIRPATTDDLPALTELLAASDTAWFGAAEHGAEEVAEFLDWTASLERDSRVHLVDDRLVAVAIVWANDTMLTVHPDADPAPLYADLLPWLAAGALPKCEALSRDDVRLTELRARGWTHTMSSFELLRQVTPELQLPQPEWPEGVTVRSWRDEDAPAVHELIYTRAGWTEVPGHPYRGYEEWLPIFVTDHTRTEQQELAFRGEELVGVSMGRTWSDGTGWVSQLAVAKSERGRGLGRALLHASLRARRDNGAKALGLSVQAENRGALTMYLNAGLEIDREWMTFAAP